MNPGALEAIDERLVSTLDDLLDQPSLAPGIVVNALFNQLVTAVLSVPESAAETVLAALPSSRSPAVFRSVASAGEHALERVWARQVSSAPDPARAFARFPYRENYRLLVEMELDAVRRQGTVPRHVLLLGSGNRFPAGARRQPDATGREDLAREGKQLERDIDQAPDKERDNGVFDFVLRRVAC